MQDWHVHNFISHDGRGHVEDFVKVSLQKGVDTLCFANHPERMCPQENVFKIDGDSLVGKLKIEREEIERCKEIYGDSIKLYQGIELENRKSLIDDNKRLLDRYTFDIVIGSCHLINDDNISSKRNQSFFKDKEEGKYYPLFLDGTIELIESFPFDVLGHFDIVKRFGVLYYGKFKAEKYADKIQEIFKLLKERKIGLEINTSGLFQNPQESYPSENLALQALEEGVPFVLTGSDAHSPEDLARGFNKLKYIQKYNKDYNIVYNRSASYEGFGKKITQS